MLEFTLPIPALECVNLHSMIQVPLLVLWSLYPTPRTVISRSVNTSLGPTIGVVQCKKMSCD
jgi:hypothetical protein